VIRNTRRNRSESRDAGEWFVRPFVRYAMAFFAALLGAGILSPLIGANWQEWAKQSGNDQYFVRYAEPVMTALARLTQSIWFGLVAGIFLGGAICLWVDFLVRRNSPAPSEKMPTIKIKQLLDCFERHAAEEAFIIYRWRHKKLKYYRFNDVEQKHPNKDGPLTPAEYHDWMGFLCEAAELPATCGALDTAIERFKSNIINLNVAYQEFQRVSDSFKKEMSRK
jgi:hypothetical protein